MYYEEKFEPESGLWYYRTTPEGSWRLMSTQEVGHKLEEAKNENDRLRRKLHDIERILEESAESKALKLLKSS
jgi:hypothetical protein